MTVPEGAHHGLYTGLVEVIGQERAGTLMAYLSTVPAAELLTKPDFERRMAQIDGRFESIERQMAHLGDRLDRLFVTLVTGLFVIVAAMGGIFAALV